MKPLVEITEAIGAEQWFTISMLRPLLHKVLHVHLVGKFTDSKIESALKNTMYSDLQNHESKRYVLINTHKRPFLLHMLSVWHFLSSG